MLTTQRTPQLISIDHIHKGFGAKAVLEDVSFIIQRQDRIGFIGENGSGKSTLAAIMMGRIAPDAGQIKLSPGVTLGYLPQEAEIDDVISVQQFMENAIGDLDGLAAQMRRLEQAMSEAAPAHLPEILAEYGALQAKYEARGGYEVEHRLSQVLDGLALAQLNRSLPMRVLSGGEKTRVVLATLLLQAPDVLILDEPTNHLDIQALEWLESYVQTYPGALLLISHDRRFLNQVVTQIIELSPTTHKLTIYHGNYDVYLAERAFQAQQQAQAYEEQQAEIAMLEQKINTAVHASGKGRKPTDNDKFLQAFKSGRNDVLKSREIKNAKQRLERIQENLLERPDRRWKINADFTPDEAGSREMLRLVGVSKAYGERCLFRGVSASIRAGQRVVLQGPNGVGKTTLLRIILGLEQPDSGTVFLSPSAKIGYLDQEQETLDPNQTVFQIFSQGLTGQESDLRASLHKYGLFKNEEVLQPISTLSIGQRRKLQIARLIATRANMLLLDEPTNHLDLASVEQFEAALREFSGTVFAISHDRYFAEHVATELWSFHDGELRITTL